MRDSAGTDSADSVAAHGVSQEKNRMKGAILRCELLGTLLLGHGLALSAQEAAKHPIAFDDMIKLHRIAEPQVSPNGKWVAYTVTTPDMETNRGVRHIWVVATTGGAAMQLTQSGHD